MSLKKNPVTYRMRSRLPEREVLSRNGAIGMGMKFIYIAKNEITHWMSLQQKEAKRKELRKEFINGFLDATYREAKNMSKEDRANAGLVFDALWEANKNDMGFYEDRDRVKVPLELLSKEQIRDMPKSSFTPKEWDSLSEEDQRIIEKSDITTQRRTVDLGDLIEGIYLDSEDRSEKYDTDEMLEGFIQHNASFVATPPTGDRYRSVKSLAASTGGIETVESLFDYASSRGIDAGEVTEGLAYELEDPDNWESNIEEWDYTEGFGVVPIPRDLRISKNDFRDLAEATQEELDAAFDLADRNYPVNAGFGDSLTVKKIRRLSSMSTLNEDAVFDMEPSHVAIFQPDWTKIEEAVSTRIEELAREDEDQFHSDGEPEPEEDRILYTFKDGSYVIRMIPEDLIPTGEALSQCIRDPEYGFGNKIKSGTHALYSIRTKKGRPRITIEIALDENGEPAKVEQIYGKGNRFVGWATGTPGQGKVKFMEVQQVGKVLELLGLTDFTSEDIRRSIGLAHDAMQDIDPEMKLTRNPGRRRR